MSPLVLVILGGLLHLAGLVGCILPVLPGPPLSWLGLLSLHFAFDDSPFSTLFLLLALAAAIGVTVLDYVVPAAGARKAGARKDLASSVKDAGDRIIIIDDTIDTMHKMEVLARYSQEIQAYDARTSRTNACELESEALKGEGEMAPEEIAKVQKACFDAIDAELGSAGKVMPDLDVMLEEAKKTKGAKTSDAKCVAK